MPFFDNFFNNPISSFYKLKSLFDYLDLSPIPIYHSSKRGPKGFPKTAMFRALLLIPLFQLNSFPALSNFLLNNPHFFHLCGFNPLSHPVPSPKSFSRFLHSLNKITLYKIFILNRNSLRNYISPSSFASLDALNIFAPVSENNPKSFKFIENKFSSSHIPPNCTDAKLGVRVLSNKQNNSKLAYFWGFKAGLTVDSSSESIISFSFAPANKHDSFAFSNSILQLRKLNYRYFIADAAFDSKSIYLKCLSSSITPFIALNIRNQKSPPSNPPFICKANLTLTPEQPYFDKSRNLFRQRFHCPLKNPSDCPINHPKSSNLRGCTKYLQFGNNPRFAIDRNSDYFKNNYAKRTASERVNSRLKL